MFKSSFSCPSVLYTATELVTSKVKNLKRYLYLDALNKRELQELSRDKGSVYGKI